MFRTYWYCCQLNGRWWNKIKMQLCDLFEHLCNERTWSDGQTAEWTRIIKYRRMEFANQITTLQTIMYLVVVCLYHGAPPKPNQQLEPYTYAISAAGCIYFYFTNYLYCEIENCRLVFFRSIKIATQHFEKPIFAWFWLRCNVHMHIMLLLLFIFFNNIELLYFCSFDITSNTTTNHWLKLSCLLKLQPFILKSRTINNIQNSISRNSYTFRYHNIIRHISHNLFVYSLLFVCVFSVLFCFFVFF